MVHDLALGDSAKGCRIVYGITLMPGPEKCKRFMCNADHVRRWDGPSALGVVRGPKPGPVAEWRLDKTSIFIVRCLRDFCCCGGGCDGKRLSSGVWGD